MSEYEQDHEKRRQNFRDTHPPPNSPRRRRRPVNNENEAPSRIPLDEQERRLAIRQASRNDNVQDSPRRRRQPMTAQHVLRNTTLENHSTANISFIDQVQSLSTVTKLPTPPATQTNVEESGLTPRQIGQRRRRLREKEEAARKQQQASASTELNVGTSLPRIDLRHPPTTLRGPTRATTLRINHQGQHPLTPPSTQAQVNRSTGQLRRRQREHDERERTIREMLQPGAGTRNHQPGLEERARFMSPMEPIQEDDDQRRRHRQWEIQEGRDHSEREQHNIQEREGDGRVNAQGGRRLIQELEGEQDQDRGPDSDEENSTHETAHFINPFLHTRGNFCAARRPYVDGITQHDIGRMDRECPFCGALHWVQERTAGSQTNPQFGMCCDKGKVRLPDQPPPPPLLRYLAESRSRAATEFRENIAQYNCALAFTSVAVEVDERVNHVGRGQPVFRIHGELRHWAGTLLPRENTAPSYAQLYILDPHAALQYRMHRNGNLDPHIMRQLQNMIRDVNPYAAFYLSASEVLQEHPNSQNCFVRLRLLPGQDRRRYNEPRVEEVAALAPDNTSQASNSRDIILRLRVPHGGYPLQRIWDTHPAYAPLHYVLLFPHGGTGWDPMLRLHEPDKENPRRLTLTRYVAYHLHSRVREYSLFLRSGRLFHRWLVDMWAVADQQRLAFLRLNQKQLRAEVYQGLSDAIHTGDVDLHSIGRRIVLPSSYVGGPRYMHQRFQDGMALVRHYKKIDLFITVTANPEWPEITRELLPGQTAYDRPELVSRVFKLKKDAIVEDIYKNGIFGRAVAYIYSIEFQKRGLPHMHLLVILQDDFKLRTPDDVDTCIRAYWPDPETEPALFDVVRKNMVHGPCGAANPTCVCMDDGKCQKNFPKEFQERTMMDENGYPKYKRPNDGRKYQVGRFWVDNSWIVPYCPYLSAKYNCHINVECAATISAVKYTVKYVHKGGDRGSLEVGETDEIKLFLEGRYFSCSEAAWRTLHFDIHEQDPPVLPLQVHLEGEHMIAFDPNDDPDRIADQAAFTETTLTAFFKANTQEGGAGADARRLLYQDFPAHFVFERAIKRSGKPACWKPRKKGFSIGRMYYVPPTAGERFYLRKLLTAVRGPTSFTHLRTVNGIVYPTYRDTCLALGLLSDDTEWHQCLEEAKLIKSGRQLRHLFVTILQFCEPARPEVLWQAYRMDICDDLEHRLRLDGFHDFTQDDVFDYGLYLVEQLLRESGRSLHDFPSMPHPERDWGGVVGNPLIAEQLSYDRESEKAQAEERLAQMNEEQRAAYDIIMASVFGEPEVTERGKVFFLDGPGGTGKTFVYNTLCHAVRGEGWIVLCVASTGIAALILPGGRTGHSMFKIPIEGLTAESTCGISKNSHRAELMRLARLIIYDEAPMQHKHGFEAIDRTLRDLKEIDEPFGGIPFVFGGDFKQTLPVIPRGTREDIVTASLCRSYLWEHLTVLKLRRNMRLSPRQSEQDFASWLLDIGNGKDISPVDGTISIPGHMRVDDYNTLIDYVYPDIHPNAPAVPAPEYFLDRAILAPRNVDVYATNTEVLGRMPGEETIFYSVDTVVRDRNEDAETSVPEEVLRSIDPAGLPPGELHIKVGCPLILLRNLAPGCGLCNGTRMVVVQASHRVLEVKIIGGDHHGEHAFIPRISLTPSDEIAMPFIFRRLQYPVRLAFAISINKSQGQSIKVVGLDVRSSVFSHGQLYVALSRVTSSQNIRILLSENVQECRTTNVVYTEVLVDHI